MWTSAAAILAFGFANNQWKVADDKWFQTYQLDTESLIVGRLAKSQQDGIFSEGGLTGRSKQQGADDTYQQQYLLYTKNLPIYKFARYESQIGFQAMLFGLADKLTDFTNDENLAVFKMLTSILTAVTVTAIIFWFLDQFGIFAGIVVFVSTLLSQWMVVFGRTLWWVIWAFYIPILVSFGVLNHEDRVGRYSNKKAGLLLFTAVFIKCLFNGYEYITTTLIMMVTPYIYYGIRDKWGFRKLSFRIIAAGASGLAAVLASMVILVLQLSSVRGGLIYGVKHIIYSFGKRTYGNPDLYPEIYKVSLQADTFSVLGSYFKGTWCNLGKVFFTDSSIWPHFELKLRYGQIILLYFIFTVIGVGLLYSHAAQIKKHHDRLLALIGATWFSMLAPLSWFIIFKGHSYLHKHINFITWHMPFMFFGFALAGYVMGLSVLILKARIIDRYRSTD